MKKYKSERDKIIDIGKGYAIILMLFGHCSLTPKPLNVWIISFHMPLFLVLSGMVLSVDKYKNIREFIKKKCESFLIPYLGLSILLFILNLILRSIQAHRILFTAEYIKKFIGIFIGWRLSDFYFSMWYILVIFFSEILIYILIRKKNNNKKYIALLSFVCSIIGYIVTIFVKGTIFSLDLVPISITFILIGYLLKDYKKIVYTKNIRNFICMIFLLIINIVFSYLNYKFNLKGVQLYRDELGHYLYFMIGALSGTIFSIFLCSFISQNRILEYIGKNSIIFYAFNNLIAIPISTTIVRKIIKLLNIDSIFASVIVVGIAITLLSIITEIINKFFPSFVGKKNKRKYST